MHVLYLNLLCAFCWKSVRAPFAFTGIVFIISPKGMLFDSCSRKRSVGGGGGGVGLAG